MKLNRSVKLPKMIRIHIKLILICFQSCQLCFMPFFLCTRQQTESCSDCDSDLDLTTTWFVLLAWRSTSLSEWSDWGTLEEQWHAIWTLKQRLKEKAAVQAENPFKMIRSAHNCDPVSLVYCRFGSRTEDPKSDEWSSWVLWGPGGTPSSGARGGWGPWEAGWRIQTF